MPLKNKLDISVDRLQISMGNPMPKSLFKNKN